MIKEESDKRIVQAQEVRQSAGAERERWKLAAEQELNNNFINQGAFRDKTSGSKEVRDTTSIVVCVVTG